MSISELAEIGIYVTEPLPDSSDIVFDGELMEELPEETELQF